MSKKITDSLEKLSEESPVLGLLAGITIIVVCIAIIFICWGVGYWLWGIIAVAKFGLPTLTFWEYVGLNFLVDFLFGSKLGVHREDL